jgi:hypothetical protein
MCGRIIQSGGPLRYAIVDGMNARDSRVHNYPPGGFNDGLVISLTPTARIIPQSSRFVG